MKTLRMIGMAVVAILMCINLMSCSDEEDYAEMIVGTWYISDWNQTFTFVEGGVLKFEQEYLVSIRGEGSWSILDNQLNYSLTKRVSGGIIISTVRATILELTSSKMVTNGANGTIVYTRK